MKKIKILFLAANPVGTNPLQLDKEIRAITDKIRASQYRDAIELISFWAARPDDLLQALDQHKPQIVHFSGHGSTTGEILLSDESTDAPKPISPNALSALFEVLKDNIRVVILNGCNTYLSTGGIRDTIDCTIGMNAEIGDRAAITFTSSFYRAIGFGRSVKDAFEQGKVALMLEGNPDEKVPELLCRQGIDPSQVILTDQYEEDLEHAPSHKRKNSELRQTDMVSFEAALEQTDRVVLLIGAGVSHYLGQPTLDEILSYTFAGYDDIADRIRRTCNAIEASTRAGRKAVFEEVIGRLRYYMDVAEMLSTDAPFRHELGSIPSGVDSGAFRDKWWQALTRCYRILLQSYGPQRIKIDSAAFRTTHKLLEELANVNSGHLHVFTTNYDCSFQVLASHCQNSIFFTHINNHSGQFDKDWHCEVPHLEGSGKPSIYVHRFHGCVAWFTNNDSTFHIDELYGAGNGLEVQDDDHLHRMGIKLAAAQPVGTNPAFALTFDEFYHYMRYCRVLLVWGFSFRDLEILQLVNQAFLREPPPLVLYVDPFQSESTALQRIRLTLMNAPIQVNPQFKLKRIDWLPTDGDDKLVEKTLQAIKENLI